MGFYSNFVRRMRIDVHVIRNLPLFQGIVERSTKKSGLLQRHVEQQGCINHMEVMLRAEREHIKKNQEDWRPTRLG